ncbi:hypothetical protein MMC26_003555 [Xylographa opegraphella]|nr:hypothetical protein [Xylographa opegraphella]
MANFPDIPLGSPLRIYPKRDLPQSFASTYAYGHISGHERSAAAQRAFDARKATILQSMTAEQAETAYQDTVKKIIAVLEEDRKKNEEVDREVEKLTKQREMERMIFRKMKERSGKVDGPAVKEESEA